MQEKNPYIEQLDKRLADKEQSVLSEDLPMLALCWEVRQLRVALANVLAAK
jgi:hypothetical protein